MAYEYVKSVSLQTILAKRDHKDKYIGEAATFSAAADIDIADFMVEDIKSGNTATMRSIYKDPINRFNEFRPYLVNGSHGADYNHGTIDDHTFYGACPVKDDYSVAAGTNGYFDMPKTDARRKHVDKFMKSFNMELESLHTAVLEPEDIPALTDRDFKPYKKAWELSEELQSEYPTLAAYREQMVKDLNEQRENVSDISDVYTTVGAIGSELGETNTIALYHTCAETYPKVTFNGVDAKIKKDFPYQNYIMELVSGNFSVLCGWKEWSHIIRRGVVKDEFDVGAPKWRKAKANHKYYHGSTANRGDGVGDPIIQVIKSATNIASVGKNTPSLLEIQVQLTATTYGEIRIWGYGSLHGFTDTRGDYRAVFASVGQKGGTDTVKDSTTVPNGTTYVRDMHKDAPGGLSYTYSISGPDVGSFQINSDGLLSSLGPLMYNVKSKYHVVVNIKHNILGVNEDTYITVEIENTNGEPDNPSGDDPFDDISSNDKGLEAVLFPLEYKASKHIPLFRRERFLRESVILCVYSVKRIKLKWYQTGIFKVVFFVVAVVVAWWTGGQSLTLYSLATAAITTVIKMLVFKVIGLFLSDIIDAAWLLAVFQLIYSVYTQDFSQLGDPSVLAGLAIKTMDAVNSYNMSQVRKKAEELKDEVAEFEKKVRANDEEMKTLMEEAGTIALESPETILGFISTLVNPETEEQFINRTLNLDLALVDGVNGRDDVNRLMRET